MARASLFYLSALACSAAAVALALGPQVSRRAPDPPALPAAVSLSSFTNFESGHIHPVDITPDGQRLLVCNTADARLAVFDLSTGVPFLLSEIPVGLDPISVRARTDNEAWVVNTISDSVSVVDLSARNVIATIKTRDEPSDVVFAGSPQRAFVSCSTPNLLQVFNPANLAAAPLEVPIKGKNPRALAVSPDGQTVYAAVFMSGNASTILGGSNANFIPGFGFPPNVVSLPGGPYGGQNPPPNSGGGFSPPMAPGNPSPPHVAHIVRKDALGRWMDDNNRDWTASVSGPHAADSGRIIGWDMPDRDLAFVNASSLTVSYATGLMNICAGIGVNPATGAISIVGTDGTNQVRFEPNLKGRFVRVLIATVDAASAGRIVKDLNPHLLPYSAQQLPQAQRDRSIGDPRGIVWNSAGTRGYITGLGSNNVVVVDAAGDRAGLADTIPVGEGPTGLALDEPRGRLYILNRFAATISVVSTATESVIATVSFFDPTPGAIKLGRKHLYDTHKNSGLGQASCASCHIDSRMDGLAWDLGDPQGPVKLLTGQNLGAGIQGLAPPFANPAFEPWHPMKGPMVTQTLQDIIGKEPHHWRGDRAGIEEFNGAFDGLLGDDTQLTPAEMQQFEDFLATIYLPPNPYRNFDNSLPTSLPTGQPAPARFGAPGQPLPNGNAAAGLVLFRGISPQRRLDQGSFTCAQCHTLPTGIGPDSTAGAQFPIGPMGERHAMLTTFDNSFATTLKTPQLRNLYFKLGFDCQSTESLAGFGFSHDGAVDTIARFCSLPQFDVSSNQEIADLTAFIMCLSGSDLPLAAGIVTPSKDVPASVGAQTTLASATPPTAQLSLISSMISLAQQGKVGLIVKGRLAGEPRGFAYVPAVQMFQSDRAAQAFTPAALQSQAGPGSELTYTAVRAGNQTRMGIDRDEDGVLDGDVCYANCDGSTAPPALNILDFSCFLNRFAAGDPYANCDGSTAPPVLNILDFSCFLNRFAAGCP